MQEERKEREAREHRRKRYFKPLLTMTALGVGYHEEARRTSVPAMSTVYPIYKHVVTLASHDLRGVDKSVADGL